MRHPLINSGDRTNMRLPTRRESQEIDQVVMIKPLPESLPELKNHALFRRRSEVPHLDNSSELLPNENETQILTSANENDSSQRGDSHVSDVSDDAPDPTYNRNLNFTNEAGRQMTIFYNNYVYVFDNVATDKAHAIFGIAGGKNTLDHDSTSHRVAPTIENAHQLQVASPTPTSEFTYPLGLSKSRHNARISQLYRNGLGRLRKADPEGRKASLQRYLEKRKDRERLKLKRRMESSSNLEMHVNSENSNDQLSQVRQYSPPKPRRMPHPTTKSNSVEIKPPNNAAIPIDLNKNV